MRQNSKIWKMFNMFSSVFKKKNNVIRYVRYDHLEEDLKLENASVDAKVNIALSLHGKKLLVLEDRASFETHPETVHLLLYSYTNYVTTKNRARTIWCHKHQLKFSDIELADRMDCPACKAGFPRVPIEKGKVPNGIRSAMQEMAIQNRREDIDFVRKLYGI